MVSVAIVPLPGEEVKSNAPPSARMRSRMLNSPNLEDRAPERTWACRLPGLRHDRNTELSILRHADGGLINTSMFCHVNEQFPDGLKDEDRLIFGQRHGEAVLNVYVHGQPILLAHLIAEPFQRSAEPKLVKRHRRQLGDKRARIRQGLLENVFRLAEPAFHLRVHGTGPGLGHFETGAHQQLCEIIVKICGNSATFTLFGDGQFRSQLSQQGLRLQQLLRPFLDTKLKSSAKRQTFLVHRMAFRDIPIGLQHENTAVVLSHSHHATLHDDGCAVLFR